MTFAFIRQNLNLLSFFYANKQVVAENRHHQIKRPWMLCSFFMMARNIWTTFSHANAFVKKKVCRTTAMNHGSIRDWNSSRDILRPYEQYSKASAYSGDFDDYFLFLSDDSTRSQNAQNKADQNGAHSG